jgi:hypothetical protein
VEAAPTRWGPGDVPVQAKPAWARQPPPVRAARSAAAAAGSLRCRTRRLTRLLEVRIGERPRPRQRRPRGSREQAAKCEPVERKALRDPAAASLSVLGDCCGASATVRTSRRRHAKKSAQATEPRSIAPAGEPRSVQRIRAALVSAPGPASAARKGGPRRPRRASCSVCAAEAEARPIPENVPDEKGAVGRTAVEQAEGERSERIAEEEDSEGAGAERRGPFDCDPGDHRPPG